MLTMSPILVITSSHRHRYICSARLTNILWQNTQSVKDFWLLLLLLLPLFSGTGDSSAWGIVVIKCQGTCNGIYLRHPESSVFAARARSLVKTHYYRFDCIGKCHNFHRRR